MPFIHVTSLPFEQPLDTVGVLEQLTRRFAEESGIGLEYVTATWNFLPPGGYAVAGHTRAHQPADSHPILVDLLVPDFTGAERVAELLPIVADALHELSGVPRENIFINCRKAASGHVWDEGGVARW